MRLTGKSDDEPLREVWAYLSREELFALHLSLAYYFEMEEDEPGWHTHVGGGAGEPELTIAFD